MPRRTPRFPDPDDLASRRVKYEREQRGWSTAELARRVTEAGVPMRQPAVWQVENGKPRRKLSLGEAVAIAEVFGISIYDLTEPPAALVTAQVAVFNDKADELIAHLDAVWMETLELLNRIAPLPSTAADLLDYMGAGGFGLPEVERLQENLTRAADLTIKVRDELAELHRYGEKASE
jgi:transcriptional regulator with XRE-family HTH domain